LMCPSQIFNSALSQLTDWKNNNSLRCNRSDLAEIIALRGEEGQHKTQNAIS
jgi:hypothetical protein